jgi:hypothetical protein
MIVNWTQGRKETDREGERTLASSCTIGPGTPIIGVIIVRSPHDRVPIIIRLC